MSRNNLKLSIFPDNQYYSPFLQVKPIHAFLKFIQTLQAFYSAKFNTTHVTNPVNTHSYAILLPHPYYMDNIPAQKTGNTAIDFSRDMYILIP